MLNFLDKMQKKFGGLKYLYTFGSSGLKYNKKNINELQVFPYFIFVSCFVNIVSGT